MFSYAEQAGPSNFTMFYIVGSRVKILGECLLHGSGKIIKKSC